MKSKLDQVNTFKEWWYTIDCGDGVISKGVKIHFKNRVLILKMYLQISMVI